MTLTTTKLAAGVVALLMGCASPGSDSPPSTSAGPPETSSATGTIVKVGLEVVATNVPPELRGKRLGLVVHSASVTVDGRHAIDVLREAGLDIVRLFSPEHGLRGRAAAGEAVADSLDRASGLPIVSLYGEHRKPRPEDLAGLDTLVFDLQGAGVRFYTYVSTMILCLEAAGQEGLDMVILDRPNPLGGERVEGPVAAPREVVPSSFVNLAPGPLVHGLTLGEMARYVNSTLSKPARLTVIPMEGWQRSMTWADTGRPWVPPSPNLRTANAALAYPGTALLEATNLSEGRGTEAPFLVLGAPWLETTEAPVEVPGFQLHATRFTPTASPAASHPKYLDEHCKGFEVRVTNAANAEPYRLGLTLLDHFSRRAGFTWRREGEALTWLLGSNRVYRDRVAGRSVDEILAADTADHTTWKNARRAALLY